jgi:hypothetical protein
VTITLIYPSFYAGQPHVAEVEADVRLTPTQIVLVKPHKETLRYVNGHDRGPTGIGGDLRWRRNGSRVGYSASQSWRPSRESLAMIREQSADHAAK